MCAVSAPYFLSLSTCTRPATCKLSSYSLVRCHAFMSTYRQCNVQFACSSTVLYCTVILCSPAVASMPLQDLASKLHATCCTWVTHVVDPTVESAVLLDAAGNRANNQKARSGCCVLGCADHTYSCICSCSVGVLRSASDTQCVYMYISRLAWACSATLCPHNASVQAQYLNGHRQHW